ncbi:serine acetyltransferase [Salmonella enterica]
MDLKYLKKCIAIEVLAGKPFSWRKAFTRTRHDRRKYFMFWWRVACFLYSKGGIQKSVAKAIERKLQRLYSIEIPLTAKIGAGLKLAHLTGIVVTNYCVIGERVTLKQGVTIGLRLKPEDSNIVIGDDVDIGCNSSILGGKVTIGNNVIIGAHSLVVKSIPPNSIYKNRILSELRPI